MNVELHANLVHMVKTTKGMVEILPETILWTISIMLNSDEPHLSW